MGFVGIKQNIKYHQTSPLTEFVSWACERVYFWMKRAQAAITMTPIIISPFVNFRWIGESMNWFLWWTFLTVFLCLFCVILKISFSFFFLRDCLISICEHSPVFKIKVLGSGYSTCVTVEKKIFKLFQFHIRWYYTVHYIKYLSWSTVFYHSAAFNDAFM